MCVGGGRATVAGVNLRRAPTELRTERLLLRQLRAEDREAFAAINADREVMQWIGTSTLDRRRSDELWWRVLTEWKTVGHGLWGIERLADGELLGFCGLAIPSFMPQLLPAVEIGWRLRRDAWGKGYATEAARAAIACGWEVLELAQVIAIVHPDNERSLLLGDRLGMRVTNRIRHAPTGWDVLVLRLDRPEPVEG